MTDSHDFDNTSSHGFDNTGSHGFDHLDELIEQSLTDQLSPLRHAELERLLAENEEACRAYLRLMQQHLTLTRLVGPSREPSLPAELQAVSGPAVPSPVGPTWLRGAMASSFDWRGHPWRFSATVLALTVVFWGVFVGIIGPQLNETDIARTPTAAEQTARRPVVAQLTGVVDAVWADDSGQAPSPGERLRQECCMRLKAGLAQLVFRKGATVVIEGPAKFTLNNANSLRLDLGRLAARVPRPAQGFAVDTPHARIADLGTEFGVVVEPRGETLLHVQRGEVELALHARPAASLQRVTRGQAVRVEASSVQPIDLPPTQRMAFQALLQRNTPGLIENLVDNGGFVPEAEPNGWMIIGNTAHMARHADRDTDGDDCHLIMAVGNEDETRFPLSVVYQTVDVEAGKPHYFTFHHTAWAQPGDIHLYVDIFDGAVNGADLSDHPIGDGGLLGVRLPHAKDRAYQRYRTLITPTQNQVTIRFSDKGNSTTYCQDLWVDRVWLVGVEKPAGEDLPSASVPKQESP